MCNSRTASGSRGGSPLNLSFALLTLLVILTIERFAPPAFQRLSILLGLIIGTLISIPFGLADFSGAAVQNWIGISTPFHFGFPPSRSAQSSPCASWHW